MMVIVLAVTALLGIEAIDMYRDGHSVAATALGAVAVALVIVSELARAWEKREQRDVRDQMESRR